ncbi:transferase hexapeptide repeat family protein [Cupriavidus sp. DF5525]|uniref:acyltransferase n=1 Tax=Cupriavidus sp. DF5525 TaxID=3160989 RepID=UPI0032DE7C43
MAIYEFNGVRPQVHPTAFVHPLACLIGQVIVGANCYIAPFASLRGDFGGIEVGEGSNIQESCTLHAKPGEACRLAANSHVGHGAIVHGAKVEQNCLIGMNAVVMDDVAIGENSIVAASAFVKAGMLIPPNSLVGGLPATVIRALSDVEIKSKAAATRRYQVLAADCHRSLLLVG